MIETNNNCSVTDVRRFAAFVESLEGFNLRSSVGRRALHNLRFTTDAEALCREYDLTDRTRAEMNDDMEHALSEVQDITGTIERLTSGETMDDVQLFEIKHMCLMAELVHRSGAGWLESMEPVVRLLDPNNETIDTFYIYDSYDTELARMRRMWREPTAEQFALMNDAEDRVRARLTDELRPFAPALGNTLVELGLLDLRIAKCHLMESEGLTRPTIESTTSSFHGLVNLETRTALRSRGRDYQPVDVEYGNEPNIITGINMGGKTVVLRALADAQTMCQYGFPVPAREAGIVLADDVLVSIDDSQDHRGGLSSFAAEMLKVDAILRQVAAGRRVLVLIDEPARTTNPTEGRIIVNRVIEKLSESHTRAFITTHYDGIHGPYRRLRVKGLADERIFSSVGDLEGAIDYSLVETSEEEVPHEALRVARMLGITLFD